MTQAMVAEKLGRHQSFVATVESGQRRIDVVEFLDFAQVIGFSPEKAIAELTYAHRASSSGHRRQRSLTDR